MAVTKAVTPAIAKLGQVVTYTTAIQSIGEAIASGVIMTDPLPSGVIFCDWVKKGLGTLAVPLRMVK